MKTKITSLFVAVIAAVAALAILRGVPAPTAVAEADAVKAARLRQNAAIASDRVDDIASFWTDEVTICRGLGIQLAGKAAYRKLFADDIGSPSRVVYERLPSVIDVSPHWPLAFETGDWNGHAGSLAGPTIISGRYSAQWVKRGGRWLIRAEVYVALDGSGVGLESKAAP